MDFILKFIHFYWLNIFGKNIALLETLDENLRRACQTECVCTALKN